MKFEFEHQPAIYLFNWPHPWKTLRESLQGNTSLPQTYTANEEKGIAYWNKCRIASLDLQMNKLMNYYCYLMLTVFFSDSREIASSSITEKPMKCINTVFQFRRFVQGVMRKRSTLQSITYNPLNYKRFLLQALSILVYSHWGFSLDIIWSNK